MIWMIIAVVLIAVGGSLFAAWQDQSAGKPSPDDEKQRFAAVVFEAFGTVYYYRDPKGTLKEGDVALVQTDSGRKPVLVLGVCNVKPSAIPLANGKYKDVLGKADDSTAGEFLNAYQGEVQKKLFSGQTKQPEREAKWIRYDHVMSEEFRCGNCRATFRKKQPFCPGCGCKMTGVRTEPVWMDEMSLWE